MAWKTMDVHEQRVRFVVAATQRARPFSALCAEYEISRPTGYLWLQRYRQQGVPGIAEQSRRPHRSPRRTDAAVEQQVVLLRRRYPDWGARKLRVLLAREGLELPRNTIHRILLRHDLVREEDRRTSGGATLRARAAQRVVADGFQGAEGLAASGGAALGARRPQPLPDRPGSQRQHARRTGARAAGRGLPALRCARRDADGSRHAVVEHEVASGRTHLSLWLMRQGIRLHWSRIRHPQTQGKVERFHGSLHRALVRRGIPRIDHASVAGCLSLGTQPRAAARSAGDAHSGHAVAPSPRRYDPHPPRWEYPQGSWVLKVDCKGKIEIKGQKWRVGKALSGEWVQIVRVEQRMMVFYCTTLIRELDPGTQRSTIVERWVPHTAPAAKV